MATQSVESSRLLMKDSNGVKQVFLVIVSRKFSLEPIEAF
jgi:hypothetical protein